MKRNLAPRPQEPQVKLAMSIARSFHHTTGLDLDDLFQQACLAYVEALRSPKFDPTRAKFTTFAYWKMRSKLLNYCETQQRYNKPLVSMEDQGKEDQTLDWLESISDAADGPDNYTESNELMRRFLAHLDADGRMVAELVIVEAPADWADVKRRCSREFGTLRRWSKPRIRRALWGLLFAARAELRL